MGKGEKGEDEGIYPRCNKFARELLHVLLYALIEKKANTASRQIFVSILSQARTKLVVTRLLHTRSKGVNLVIVSILRSQRQLKYTL